MSKKKVKMFVEWKKRNRKQREKDSLCVNFPKEGSITTVELYSVYALNKGT